MGFVPKGSRGTVKGPSDDDFDPEGAAKKLYESMKGLGTDENAISDVIGGHTNEQRQVIKEKYKTMYGKDLAEDLGDELGGISAKVVLALVQEPDEYLIDCVHKAIEGLGTDENGLIGILCGRSNDEMSEMKAAYLKKYEKEMEADVSDDLSGELKAFIVSLMTAGREEGDEIDEEKVKQDAQDLYEASIGPGTTESVFNSILNLRSSAHLRDLFDKYQDMAEGKTIEELIDSEFSGNLKTAYLTLIQITRNVVVFYAERLHKALKGAGTDDETLMQIIVSRSEVDLQDIAEYYAIKFEKSLAENVENDTSGDYRRILLRVIGGQESEAE